MTKDKLREYNIGDEDDFATRSTYATVRSGRGNRRKCSTKMAHMARRLSDVFGRHKRVQRLGRQIPENGKDDDFDKAIELLNAHFEPQKHRLYDISIDFQVTIDFPAF